MLRGLLRRHCHTRYGLDSKYVIRETQHAQTLEMNEHEKNLDLLDETDFELITNIITKEEETELVNECNILFKRRRYQNGHWDDVILKYKEIEKTLEQWENPMVLESLQKVHGFLPTTLVYLPKVHVIDLASDGYIKPHVDSIKFSGELVAGLSLASSCLLQFTNDSSSSPVDTITVLLPPRSMYIMRCVFIYF